MRARYWGLALLLTGSAWVVAGRGEGSDRGQVQRKVLSAVRVHGKAQPLAGVSARADIDVKALSERRIGADRHGPDYHRYVNRCATCHVAPAPDLHRAAEWPQVVDRMHANMRSAGTLGLAAGDRGAVLRFLARHARP